MAAKKEQFLEKFRKDEGVEETEEKEKEKEEEGVLASNEGTEDAENAEQGETVVVEDAVQEEESLEEETVPEDVVQKEEALEEENVPEDVVTSEDTADSGEDEAVSSLAKEEKVQLEEN